MNYSVNLGTAIDIWSNLNVVNEWEPPKEQLQKENHQRVNCSIISPTYQNRLVEHYTDPSMRQKARLDLHRTMMIRQERAIIQNKEKKHNSLIGRVEKDPVVNVYVTDSEYNLPGTLEVSKSRLPKLKDLQLIRDKPSSSKTKEKKRLLNLFQYEAYYGLKNTLQFLWDVFKLKSYDNRGTDVKASVDVVNEDEDPDTNNAYWNGKQMYFGMGTQDWFTRFTIDQDIIAHEFGHAVIQASCDLEYSGQSGAINEHFADVVGILVKQYFGGLSTRNTFEASFETSKRKPQMATDGNYKIGEEVLIDKKGTYCLRDMEYPGTAFRGHPVLGDDEQPDHFGAYVKLPDHDDNGGVHKYSGFLNRAFVITAKLLGGYAWDEAGQIWFKALKHLKPTAQFADLVEATLNAAKEGHERDAVRKAWTTVGLL